MVFNMLSFFYFYIFRFAKNHSLMTINYFLTSNYDSIFKYLTYLTKFVANQYQVNHIRSHLLFIHYYFSLKIFDVFLIV